MSFKGFAGKFVNEARLNPNVGTAAYVLHRITGIGLAVYLMLHTWVLSSARESADSFTHRLASVQSPVFHFLELFLTAAVFYHMLNGLRIIVADFFSATRQHKYLLWVVAVIFATMMVWSACVFIPKMLAH
jgi:succinate dehydrogenase / fumarate reductase cytochrome b subunit